MLTRGTMFDHRQICESFNIEIQGLSAQDDASPPRFVAAKVLVAILAKALLQITVSFLQIP